MTATSATFKAMHKVLLKLEAGATVTIGTYIVKREGHVSGKMYAFYNLDGSHSGRLAFSRAKAASFLAGERDLSISECMLTDKLTAV